MCFLIFELANNIYKLNAADGIPANKNNKALLLTPILGSNKFTNILIKRVAINILVVYLGQKAFILFQVVAKENHK